MRVSLFSRGVFYPRHRRLSALGLMCALFFGAMSSQAVSHEDPTFVTSVGLSKNPLTVTLGLKGPSVSITSKNLTKPNRIEIELRGTKLASGVTDFFKFQSGLLRGVRIAEDINITRLTLDFGKARIPDLKVSQTSGHIALTLVASQNMPGELKPGQQKSSVLDNRASEPKKKTTINSARKSQPRNEDVARTEIRSQSQQRHQAIELTDNGQKQRPEADLSNWKNPAGGIRPVSGRQIEDRDLVAELERPFGSRRIGRAECIDIESENVCFYYEEVFLKYADPKDVIKTIDCMFNLYCPGTGQGGPGGGTEHISTSFIEQNMSPRSVIRDGKDKTKTLKPLDDRGFDRIDELRLVPVPEYPRRPFETGVDVKSWRMLRDLDRKDPKLAKIVTHSMVWADEKKRVVFLKDTENRLMQIRKVIRSLDRPSLQVLVQSRIVRAHKNWSRGLGILWGGRNNQVGVVKDGANTYWGFGGNQEGYEAGFHGPSNRPTGQSTIGVDIPSTFAVNLPALVNNMTNLMGLGVQFGLLKPNYITELDLRLQLGETSGQAKIVARPEIQVMDGERAIIKNGVVMTLKTSSPNWGTHTELVPVDLKLEITPKVLFNNRIRMDVDIFDNEVDGRTSCGTCEIVKLYLTREAHTTLVVGDGETCVLGGIIRDAESNRKDGWPFLMKIPIIGAFFSSRSKSTISDELLVFLTPSIVRQGTQGPEPEDERKVSCGHDRK